MAAWADLEARIDALEDAGYAVETSYKGSPPKWLREVFDGCDLYVLNFKGAKPNKVACLVPLATLEKLLAQSGDSTKL